MPKPVKKPENNLEKLSNEALYGRLRDAVSDSIRSLVEISRIVCELEKRGEDLSSLRLSMIDYYRRIGSGEVSAELVSRFCLRKRVLDRILALPEKARKKVENEDAVELVISEDGQFRVKKIAPSCLDDHHFFQVFGEAGIRSKDEQIEILSSAPAPAPKPIREAKVVADKESGGFKVRNHFVSLASFVKAAAELKRKKSHVSPSSRATIRFLPTEMKRLDQLAEEAQVSRSEFVRDALASIGLI